MIILSHRGFWKTKDEKNTITSFKRSFDCGFGTETDLRDHDGEIVISFIKYNGWSKFAISFKY